MFASATNVRQILPFNYIKVFHNISTFHFERFAYSFDKIGLLCNYLNAIAIIYIIFKHKYIVNTLTFESKIYLNYFKY